MTEDQKSKLMQFALVVEAARKGNQKAIQLGDSLATQLLKENIWGLTDDFAYNAMTDSEKLKFWSDGLEFYKYLNSLNLPDDEKKLWYSYPDEGNQIVTPGKEKSNMGMYLGILGAGAVLYFVVKRKKK